jgi:hypothetical protein
MTDRIVAPSAIAAIKGMNRNGKAAMTQAVRLLDSGAGLVRRSLRQAEDPQT